jgi:predicted permease
MGEVLLKAAAFVFIIFLGYALKRIGFFTATDYRLVSKIVLNITLPAAVITAFANFDIDASLLILALLGLGCNLIMVGLGFLAGARSDGGTKAFYMLNASGYNIGCFAMPFAQGFLGPFGVVATCMFDSGNSIMCTGGTYAAAAGVAGTGGKSHLTGLAKKLLSSVPFDIYMLMLLFSWIGLRFPSEVLNLCSVIAGANSFLAMLMIGMMIELELEARHVQQLSFVLLLRYAVSAVFAWLFYYYTSFSLEIRQVLVLLVFAPIPAIAPLFTEKCQGNGILASLTNSVSIMISIVIMTVLLVMMNIH